MKDGKFDLKTFLDNIELYISAVLFIALTILLFANVFCRYALKHSFAWVEEVATIAFALVVHVQRMYDIPTDRILFRLSPKESTCALILYLKWCPLK